jgi:hypothetical protein
MLDRPTAAAVKLPLPTKRDLFYGGAWNPPKRATYVETISPGSGVSLGQVAEGSAADVDEAVGAAAEAFKTWRLVPPQADTSSQGWDAKSAWKSFLPSPKKRMFTFLYGETP